MMLLPIVVARQSHEPVLSALVRRIRGQLFIDVGANIGYYPRLLESNFSRIIAVEPDPLTYAYLKKLIPKNCRSVNAAVAESDGFTLLYRHPDTESSRTAYANSWKAVKVPMVSICTLLGDDTSADLVKVDAEGAEMQVLRGAVPVMRRIRSWAIERHTHTQKDELVSFMKQHGYDCKWLDRNHRFAYFQRGKQVPSISHDTRTLSAMTPMG